MKLPLRSIGAALPVLLWYLLGDVCGVLAEDLLPTLSAVVRAVEERVVRGRLTADLLATASRWLIGFALGAAVGTLLGVLLGLSFTLRELFSLPIEFLRALPVTAMLPLFLLLFGVGEVSKIAMVALPCLLLLAVHTEGGIRRTSIARLEMAKSFGASRLQCFFHVTLPEVIPSLLLGFRLALSLALVVAVVSEMFLGTEQGLGQSIYEAYMMNRPELLYAYLLVIGLIGYLAARSTELLERKALYWSGV